MKAHYVDIGIVNIIRQRLKDIELQRWLSEINNDTRKDANQSNKMRTYRLFKTIDNYKCEDYLHQVTNKRHRIALTKLRLSNHKLAIETGHYSRPLKKPAERICPICKIEMEDEYHFLNLCPAYQEKRCSLLDDTRRVERAQTGVCQPWGDFLSVVFLNCSGARWPRSVAAVGVLDHGRPHNDRYGTTCGMRLDGSMSGVGGVAIVDGMLFECPFYVFVLIRPHVRSCWTDRGYHTHQALPYRWFLKTVLLEQRLIGRSVVFFGLVMFFQFLVGDLSLGKTGDASRVWTFRRLLSNS